MSAPRPRPVTATINKPPPTGSYRAQKNVTLLSSSSGSTESLISCIDDESVDIQDSHSILSASDRPVNKEPRSDSPANRSHSPESIEAVTPRRMNMNNNNAQRDDSFSERIISEKSGLTSTEPTESTENKEPEIGPWEKWMIQKSESMKKLTQQKARVQKMKRQQAKQEQIEKKEREKKAEMIRKEWIQQKDEEKQKIERRQVLREKRKQREEEEKKREIEEKAKAKYQEWVDQKKKADALQHALEIERQKLKELELKDKKEKSDSAFKAWLEKSAQRERPRPHSYAKCDGAITGYYDSAASPSPAYYNPIPWQPVALPTSQPKPKKKNSKCKRKVIRNAWTIDN